jgi:hypothetical protein
VNVAILGTRGIPASYSGFETAVEQITSRLTARGHQVTVYCRPHVVDRTIHTWKGAELVHLPTVRNKYLDTFVHTFLSSIHAARGPRPDVALFFIAGNSPLCLITRGAGIPTVINVDGLDSDRRKWNRFAKAYLRAAERLSPRMAHRAITDSYAVAHIYEQRYGRHIGVVPYGAEVPKTVRSDVLDRLGLEPRRYTLATVHREANVQPERLEHIATALDRVDGPLVFPAHPRTRAALDRLPHRFATIEPLGYLDFAALASQARVIMTDSGGVQKEAYWYGVPCVTLRPSTEWVDTVEAGANVLADDDPEAIVRAAAAARFPPDARPLYGDGHASERVAAALYASRP